MTACDATASVAQDPLTNSLKEHPTAPLYKDPDVLIVLDTETTGLDHKTEELLEVAAVRLVNGEVTDTFSALVCPSVPIRHSSFKIHHISAEMVADAPKIDEVLPQLLAFMDGAPFVAHNAIFDYSFINEAHKKIHGERWTTRKIDTLDMYRQVFPEEASHGLSSMLQRFGFEPEVKHRALDDAMCLAQVYPKLRHLYEQRYAWQFSQLPYLDYLVERYLRLQKTVQVLQSEMSDLKQIFKLHFTEGGRPVQATGGDLMVSSTKRNYEYDDRQVWPVVEAAGLVKKAAKLNPRQLDKLISTETTDPDVALKLKEARTGMNEYRSVNFVKVQANDNAEASSAEAETSPEATETP